MGGDKGGEAKGRDTMDGETKDREANGKETKNRETNGREAKVLEVTVVWQLNQRYQKCRMPRRPELATSWKHRIDS